MIEFISQLPTEYQEVEYIESSGTQYINTGVIPTVDTGVKVRGHFTSVQNGNNIILGASDQDAFANGKPYSIDSFPDKVYLPFGGFADDSTDTITITQTANKQYEYTLNYMDSGKASVDTLQITLPTRTSMTSKALYLFCLNGNGTAGYYSHFALEYLQITQGEIVIHDYVPCYRKADNVAGLYDLVTGTFLANAGSGTFAVGNNSNKRGEWVITAGGIIPMQYALRRRMMINVSTGLPISDLPLGTLINVGTDGGAGAPNYEIADKDNLVPGGVVLVRKNIYSRSSFGSTAAYPNGTLDNLIKTTIYNKMPQQLRDKMMDVSFNLYGSGDITRKMFALTYTMAGFGNNHGVVEGVALQLYTSNASRIKTYDGSADNWWLSSRNDSSFSCRVYTDGTAIRDPSSYFHGVVPAFVIPSKTPYDPTPNTDGSYNLIL